MQINLILLQQKHKNSIKMLHNKTKKKFIIITPLPYKNKIADIMTQH